VKNSDTTPHFRGFVQVGYRQDGGTTLDKNGTNKTPFPMLTPNLDSQAGFAVNRARLAVRGMLDKDNTVDYFFMTEFGEDGMTRPAGHPSNTYLTGDASTTYRGIPHLNIRMGQFEYPGSEGGLRAVFTSEYRNFTSASSQLLLERFLPNDAKEVAPGAYQAALEQGVGAFRDRGVELFDTETVAPGTTNPAAAMAGSGTRDLPGMRRRHESRCLHRRPGGDPEDPESPEGKG